MIHTIKPACTKPACTVLILVSLILTGRTSHATPRAIFTHDPSGDSIKIYSSIDAGLLYGNISEYVYSEGKDLSRLDWDLKPLLYTGFSLAASYNRFSASIGLWSAVNTKTGFIENYDWENLDGVNTHYSRHDNILENGTFFDLNFGYMFFQRPKISLSASAGLSHSVIKMSARDGYLEYPPGSPRIEVYGVGIMYEQSLSIPWIGINAGYNISERLSVNAALQYSFAGWCNSVDNHLKRDLDFYDSVYYIQYLHIEPSLSYLLTENITVKLSGAFSMAPETKGSMYVIDTATGSRSETENNIAGISYYAFQCRISVSCLLHASKPEGGS